MGNIIFFIQIKQIKKKNLLPNTKYQFRIKGNQNGKWDDNYSTILEAYTLPENTYQLNAPQILDVVGQGEGKSIVSITWENTNHNYSQYKLQYKSVNSYEWQEVGKTVSTTTIKKKNLLQGLHYVFRVQPYDQNLQQWSVWSKVSEPVYIPHVASCFKNLLGDTLLYNTPNGIINVSTDSLSNKMIALYFSASWCGPCHQRTNLMLSYVPQLQNFPIDIVFISACRSEEQFNSYYSTMTSFKAIPYNDPKREQALSLYQIQGIPKLMIFNAQGKLVCENAAGQVLTVQQLEQWKKM